MKGQICLALATFFAGVISAPTQKRQTYSQQDIDILNYALTLEHLEKIFYAEALANYTQADFVAAGFADPFYSNLQSIAAEEAEHVAFLTSALTAAGAPATAACVYDFPATDAASFVGLAAVIEGVGVSAYTGAAMDILSAGYLTAAAQILPIEGRHTAYIRMQLGEVGFPQSFDTPLDLDEVYTVVAPFIVSCPSTNPALPVKAFPSLAVVTTGPINTNDTIMLSTTTTGAAYAAFLALTGPTFMALTPTTRGYTVQVPEGFAGQSYVVLTSDMSTPSDDTIMAGPAIFEISGYLPAIASSSASSKRSESTTKRAVTTLSADDIAVLQLAHFLENLEYNLYSSGAASFTPAEFTAAGFPAGFWDDVALTATQENVHRETLASVLTAAGQMPLPECTYKFPYTDPTSFVSLANMITTTGIGAYIGGADLVMDDAFILTAAASILAVEARHDSVLRAGLGADPAPNSFDTPVTALWAYTIAHNFVTYCPQDLYPTALPGLSMTSPMLASDLRPATPAGTPVTFTWDPSTFFVTLPSSQPVYLVFLNQVADPIFVAAGTTGAGSATVPLPAGVEGAAFVLLTTFESGLNMTELSEFGTLAGPMVVTFS